ncbi:MAG: PilZ domain-containing protein [Candidatus Lernaella stagnicola]|nr:PilZ domain-containing protein [Candidatus Lernaella stagnicola]
MPKREKNILEKRSFPRVPAYTKIRAHLRHHSEHKAAEVGNISSSGMLVWVKTPWDVGSICDFEFTLLDDVRPFIGRAEVLRITEPGCRLDKCVGLGLKFLHIEPKPLGVIGMLRHAVRMQAMSLESAIGAMRYAWAELQGNITEHEFGEPGAGFRQPVLMLHGWLGTRGVLNFLERRLKRAGFPVFSIDLGLLNVRDIEHSAEVVAGKLRCLSERMGFARISVLAHSMGGLIALWGLKKLNLAEYVSRMVAIGTPFHGSHLTRPGMVIFSPLIKTLWQMTPGSDFIQRLHEDPLPGNVDIVCFAARDDFFVRAESATLEGAKNILIDGGHASLITSRYATAKVVAVLEGRDPFIPSQR